ncbi:hypothetical protein DRN97_11480 [Methanosarcinales archaeon]|nr:MAG: hypothetical protein DRN97_11480 [Methanosarcinales archaeon]
MLEPVITAGSISGFISLIGLLYIIFTKLGRMEMKVCTLWKIYGEDVLERAVKEGLGKHESPAQITEKGEQMLGEDIKQRIETIVRKNFRFKHDDLLYEVLNKTADKLKGRAEETDTDMNLMVGVAMLYTQKVLKNQR